MATLAADADHMIQAKLAKQTNRLGARLTAKATRLAKAQITDRTARNNRSISHWHRPEHLWPLFGTSRKG